MNSTRLVCIKSVAFVSVLISVFSAQAAAKRPLTHADYASWRSISGQRLSPDGKFLAYFLFPQEGNGELVIRNIATGVDRKEPAGVRPQPSARPDAEPGAEERSDTRPPTLAFTADGKFLIFASYPSQAETDKAKKEKKKPEEMPKNGMVIVNLTMEGPASVVRIPGVKSFQIPEDGNGFIAYQREPAPAAKPGDTKSEESKNADQSRRGTRSGSSSSSSGPRQEFGSDLVLRNLADGSERVFAEVVEYAFARDAKTLVYAVGSKTKENNGVFFAAPALPEEPKAVLKGKGKYVKLTWDDDQTRIVFLSDVDDASAKQPKLKLYDWIRGAASAQELVSTATPGFRKEFVISEKGSILFSKDGKRIFFGCAPPPPAPEAAASDSSDEKPVFDLWHWNDDFIQPMQKVRATQDRSRTYRAAYHLDSKSFVQLGDATMQDVQPSDDGLFAIGTDDREYRRMVEYDARYSDYFAVNTVNGERRPLLVKHGGSLSWSPDGKHALTYKGGNWYSISIPEDKQVNLTGKLGVRFWNEDNDTPGAPYAYGTAGWTRDSKWILIYDRYDIWQVAVDGSSAKNLTAGVGRKTTTQFRHVRTDPDDRRAIDPAKPLLLSAENLNTRDTGFFEAHLDSAGEPKKLIWAAKKFAAPVKAKDADVYVLTASRFDEYPDLLITDPAFQKLQRVSNANPQREEILWGTGELVTYKNADGVQLSAALYKPENFDPKKKYPMLVYIYERLSQNVNNFVDARPGTSINASYYASNGYLVLMPDIIYKTGYPGQSAIKCVLPAIQAVVDRGYVDEKAIGIQGHSWGGYQIAYMVTQTTRFRAVAAGAPVSDMISAYDGIRWGPGLPRQFQYEKTQSRIGGTLWQYPTRFLENSPIFMADRVTTPILMLHNDADDAVPWYQGIEYFLALRRLGKEAYLFNYNGEPHGLRKRVNQKDYTVRMQEFFDHFLKGAPEPKWMEKGIPYLEKTGSAADSTPDSE